MASADADRKNAHRKRTIMNWRRRMRQTFDGSVDVDIDSTPETARIRDINGRLITVQFPSTFPFHPAFSTNTPYTFSIHSKIEDVIYSASSLFQDGVQVRRDDGSTQNVLVCFHKRPVLGKRPHFMSYYIVSNIEDGARIFTADLDQASDGEPHQDHIVADVFGDSFQARNRNFFDVVFMPDGGGEWYRSQDPFTEETSGRLADLTAGVMNVVKPGGKLHVSKFVTLDDNALDIYRIFLESMGFGVELKRDTQVSAYDTGLFNSTVAVISKPL